VDDPYLIGLIGRGIGPSLSPALHEREARRLGLRLRYRLIDIDELGVGADAAGDLVRKARARGYGGLNVTHPCKQTVVPALDELSPVAAELGAVNTVTFDGTRAVGHNTDVTGFGRAFARGLPGARLRTVVQLGAGGAGAAVAHATLELGAARLIVIDAVPARAAALASGLNRRFGAGRAEAGEPSGLAAALADADGLVHATPTGMAEHPGLPLPAALLRTDLWVAEVVYRPLETELLRTARAAGCRTLDGGGMVVYQAADAFRLFTGVEPDPDRMLGHFTDLIASGV